MFRAIYDSPWHNPAAFWAAGIVFLAWWMRKKSFFAAFVVLCTVEILSDALATGAWSPLVLGRSSWTSPVAIAFAIAGDFRYFLLVERFARRPSAKGGDVTAPWAWIAAVALSLVVPVVSAILHNFAGVGGADARWTYLLYEVLFVGLTLALRLIVVPRRLAAAPLSVRTWLLGVTSFELVQYALWALADGMVLWGADAGFALRLVPNAMYYMLFVPFVALTAPAEVEA